MTENKDKYCANGRCNEAKNGPVNCTVHKLCPDYTPNNDSTVDGPAHYQGTKCIELMRAMFGDRAVMDFCKCNSFKYRFRAGKKKGSPAAEDIAKAEWYEDYMMELYNEGAFD